MAKLADYVHEGGGLTFSPDSSHFAYAVHDGRKAYCVINGKKQPPYERIKINSLTFNPVTNELFYVAQKDGMWRVVSSSSQGPQFNDFPDQKIAFSPNGKHIAYFA